MSAIHLLVMAKAPVAGLVKTRMCPPCTPKQAAAVAAAALLDTLDAAGQASAARRTLVVSGRHAAPPGWASVAQRGTGLAERLVHAYADTAVDGLAQVLVGMDTPQLTGAVIDRVAAGLGLADAVLAPAVDGGWWALALRDPAAAQVLSAVPMSTSHTGEATLVALRAAGLRVELAPVLRDVDTAADAREVAALCGPGRRFAAAVRAHVPAEAPIQVPTEVPA